MGAQVSSQLDNALDESEIFHRAVRDTFRQFAESTSCEIPSLGGSGPTRSEITDVASAGSGGSSPFRGVKRSHLLNASKALIQILSKEVDVRIARTCLREPTRRDVEAVLSTLNDKDADADAAPVHESVATDTQTAANGNGEEVSGFQVVRADELPGLESASWQQTDPADSAASDASTAGPGANHQAAGGRATDSASVCLDLRRFERFQRSILKRVAVDRGRRLLVFVLGGVLAVHVVKQAVRKLPLLGGPIILLANAVLPTSLLGPALGLAGAAYVDSKNSSLGGS